VPTNEGKLEAPELEPPLAALRAAGSRGGGRVRPAWRLAFARIAQHPQAFLWTAVTAAVVLNLWATRGQTFFSDEWGRLLLTGDSVDSLLRGYSGHLVVLHAALYKAVFATFGADSYLPFRLIEASLIGICGVLFYALARNRADPWPCVAATLVLLFLGSATEVTATPYGIVILLPMAFGLGALVCLRRFPRDGDPLACVLLTAAVASQSVGLAFVVGAVVILALQSGRRALARSWIVLVPGLLYVAWYAWSRLTSSAQPVANPIRLHNVAEVPSTVVSVCAAGLSAVGGVFGNPGVAGGASSTLTAGYLLLGLLVVAVAWRAQSGSQISREIWVPVALGLTFWALVGMAASPARPPQASRYVYPSGAFLLLFILELTRGIRPTPRVVAVTCVAIAVSLIPNLVHYKQQADRIRGFAASERAELASLEILRGEVPAASIPPVTIEMGVLHVGSGLPSIPSSRYFAATDRYGSPALSRAQLATASEDQRQAADGVLLEAGDLSVRRIPAQRSSGAVGCRAGSGDLGGAYTVPPDGLLLRPRGRAASVMVAARRFGTGAQRLDLPPGGGALLLRPAAAQGAPAWFVLVDGARVCRP
jgi:hypothetical protein